MVSDKHNLSVIRAAVEYMTDLAGQDRTLILEMCLAMLGDLIDGDGLAPTIDYVQRWCDVIDSPEDAEHIAAEIDDLIDGLEQREV